MTKPEVTKSGTLKLAIKLGAALVCVALAGWYIGLAPASHVEPRMMPAGDRIDPHGIMRTAPHTLPVERYDAQ